MSELYRIRKLKWKKDFNDWRQRYYAETPFGKYYVERSRFYDDQEWSCCTWAGFFAEYQVDRWRECKSLAEGKKLAEAEWHSRLAKCLRPVPFGTTNQWVKVET